MKILDKLKEKIRLDKQLFVFYVILLITGIIAGSLFVTILKQEDIMLINNHLNNFLNNIESNKIDYLNAMKSNLIINVSLILIIWLLGISIIGLPIIIIIYFSKLFITGFTVSSIIATFKFKGLIFSILYIVPSQIILILILILLMIFSSSFSCKLSYSIFKRKTFDFKRIMNKYFKILLISLITAIITSLYDSYLLPIILKSLISFIR